MIRYIRVLGALLGGSIGLVLATTGNGLFRDYDASGALIALWVVAWMVVGFGVLPYLTVVPATWLIRRVEALSTAEFVTAIVGLLHRAPARACCWACRSRSSPTRSGRGCRSASRSSSGWACSG